MRGAVATRVPRLALALAFALALAWPGCAKPAPSYPPGAVDLEIDPLPLSASELLFRISVDNSLLANLSPATVRVEVAYAFPTRGVASAPLDANETTIDLPARHIVDLDLQTKYQEPGDDYWNVTVRDHAGALVASKGGVYEQCVC
jgi:hypothetical protein